jgi:hypothetical protein
MLGLLITYFDLDFMNRHTEIHKDKSFAQNIASSIREKPCIWVLDARSAKQEESKGEKGK